MKHKNIGISYDYDRLDSLARYDYIMTPEMAIHLVIYYIFIIKDHI